MKVLYEDNHIIVVEKPINIPVQEDASSDLDLLSMVKRYIKKKYQKPGRVFLGLVQRLDRPVGGVMVFARTSKAASRLSEQIRLNKLKKTYYVVAVPKEPLKGSYIKLEHYLRKNSKINKVRVEDYPFPSAKKAVLYYEVIENKSQACLLKIDLETGRPHQIRAQLAHASLPIWGDNKYGNGKPGEQIALWSSKLGFVHPVLKEYMEFVSSPPLTQYPWKIFKSRCY